jgi:hypothetical protein
MGLRTGGLRRCWQCLAQRRSKVEAKMKQSLSRSEEALMRGDLILVGFRAIICFRFLAFKILILFFSYFFSKVAFFISDWFFKRLLVVCCFCFVEL